VCASRLALLACLREEITTLEAQGRDDDDAEPEAPSRPAPEWTDDDEADDRPGAEPDEEVRDA
jgi:hypothetical protein